MNSTISGWMDDYYDYLHYLRNPQLGEMYCEVCLLEDDQDQKIHSGLGLRKMLRELAQQVLSSEDEGTTTSSSSLSSSGSSNTTSHSHNHIHKGRQRTRAVSAANKQKEEKKDAKVIRKQQSLITIDYP